MHLRGAGFLQSQQDTSKVQSHLGQEKPRRFENFTTLKRVCPSECQGAQGAFKDSMIH
jgi:hypothetical protein